MLANSYEPEKALEPRKAVELSTYEAIYSSGAELASRRILGSLVASSELFFCERLRALAPNARVLEIGCGRGDHAIMAASCHARQVVGIDVSTNAIAVAKKAAKERGLSERVSFKIADVENLPFEDSSFDLILNHEVFSSVDLEAALPELRRVLREGGVLLGIECLGHNPIYNLNRNIGVLRGRRTAWAAAHILRIEDFDRLGRAFPNQRVSYFHFISIAFCWVPYLPESGFKRSLVVMAERCDRFILTKLGFLKRYAFKCVFELG